MKKLLIEKYLPKKKEKDLIQAHIDKEVLIKIRALKEKHKFKWDELIEGLLKLYIENESKESIK